MIFKSQKDLLYRCIFYSSFSLFIVSLFSAIISREWIVIILMPCLIGLFAWIWFGSRYTVTEKVLSVRLGPYKREINIEEITVIRKIKSPLASAALSMERLEINYGHYESIQISPVNANHFIEQLQKVNPDITVEK